MDKFAIKAVLSSSRNINGWFQYYISLGFTNYMIYMDITNIALHKNVLFYANFVTIHINFSIETLEQLYLIELSVNDLLYVPPNNTLLEFLRLHINSKTLLVEIPHTNIFMHSNLTDEQQLFSNNIYLHFYKKYGFFVIKNLFAKDIIQNIIDQALNIYKTQMISLKLIDTLDIDNDTFEQNMKHLFDNHSTIFFNCCHYVMFLN